MNMEYDAKTDCWISVIDDPTVLPYAVHGAVCEEPDGTNVMLINDCLSEEAKLRAYEHESDHIRNGHLRSERPAHEIESEMKT